MPNLPDSTELFRSGLDPDKPYLRSPETVEQQIRTLLSKVVDLRARQLNQEDVPIESELQKLAQDFQAIFYGKTEGFSADLRWNRPEMLGYAIAEVAGLGGSRDDAVERLAARLINEFLDLYLQFEEEQIDDEVFKFQSDAMIEPYIYILIGLPVPE
jgi:hypothetical protein